jgi:hypothetical protein
MIGKVRSLVRLLTVSLFGVGAASAHVGAPDQSTPDLAEPSVSRDAGGAVVAQAIDDLEEFLQRYSGRTPSAAPQATPRPNRIRRVSPPEPVIGGGGSGGY